MATQTPISMQLYGRLTKYLNYLGERQKAGPLNVSATLIAEALGLNDVQVRKDLAMVSGGGKPKIGYITKDLIADIEHFLGYDNCSEAVLAGAGNLGKALLSYSNFARYGLKIVAAFDSDPALIDRVINGRKVLDTAKLANLCKRMKIRIGIITVPDVYAQEVCDAMVEGGVRAVWNFAPVNLRTPENVIVKNEDMAASLAILTRQLEENLAKYGLD